MFAESFVAMIGLASAQVVNGSALPRPVGLNQLPTAKYIDNSVALAPIKKDPANAGVQTTAKAAIIIDAQSGKTLYEMDAEQSYSIASLTKLMTAMVFLDSRPNLDEEVMMLPTDDPEGKSTFAANERLTKRDLLRALLIASSNEAAVALARSTGDKAEFIKKMNEKASELGLHQAHFTDPSGYEPTNHASVKDVALMLRNSLNYPDVLAIANQPKVTIKGKASGRSYSFNTTNLLLTSFLNKAPFKIVAGKTGTLPEAGFCLAQVTKDQEGNQVVAVVLGSETHFSRFQDVKSLTYWAFQSYKWPEKTAGIDQVASR